MFRFVYAWLPGEPFDALAADGFVGVETAAEPPPGVAWVGSRFRDPAENELTARLQAAGARAGAGRYAIVPATDAAPADAGRQLAALAGRWPDVTLMTENGGAFRTAAELWRLLEMAHPARVLVAVDVDAVRAAHGVPARLVPTLNLRIGLVRVRLPHDDVAAYARRLAGIGFEGYVVLDPPPGEGRPAAAIGLAAVFRGIFPAKPAKKAAVAKPPAG